MVCGRTCNCKTSRFIPAHDHDHECTIKRTIFSIGWSHKAKLEAQDPDHQATVEATVLLCSRSGKLCLERIASSLQVFESLSLVQEALFNLKAHFFQYFSARVSGSFRRCTFLSSNHWRCSLKSDLPSLCLVSPIGYLLRRTSGSSSGLSDSTSRKCERISNQDDGKQSFLQSPITKVQFQSWRPSSFFLIDPIKNFRLSKHILRTHLSLGFSSNPRSCGTIKEVRSKLLDNQFFKRTDG